MRILVVHNPSAGHDELSREALTSTLQRAGHDVTWFEREAGNLASILRSPYDTVVVAGGDGSVAAVARALAGRELPIAILPAGTANNLARTLGTTPDNLVECLEDGRIVSFDLGMMEGSAGTRLFLEGVGRGPFADTVALFELMKDQREHTDREEELAADLQVLRDSVLSSTACHASIELDNEETTGDFVMIEITNFGVIGPNLLLSPDAVPFDGLLDVFLVQADEREKLLSVICRQANSPPASAFPIRRARRIRFRAPAGERLHVDGETLDHDGPVDIRLSLLPGALRFYAPRSKEDTSLGVRS